MHLRTVAPIAIALVGMAAADGAAQTAALDQAEPVDRGLGWVNERP